LDPWCRSKIARLLTEAEKGGATIFYDPNFRKPHASELQKVRPALLQNIGHADLVRGSHEDFLNLFGQDDAQSVYRLLAGNGCEVVVYTRGNGTLELFAPSIQRQYEVPVVRTASTIGAGDNFNAGLLYSLSHLRITRGDLHSLDGKIWDRIIGTAISFASHVCQRYENYVAPDFIPAINYYKSP
jgi:fructokinase